MNILFVTNKNIYPLIGGIERITYVLSNALSQFYGWNCHSLYTQENNLNKTTEDVFKTKHLLSANNPVEAIARIIDNHKIQVIIAQGADGRVNDIMPSLRQACDTSISRPALLFVYHNMPGFELVSMDVQTLIQRILIGQNKGTAMRQLLLQCAYKIVPQYFKTIIAPKYKLAYDTADKMIMLSEGFIEQYNQFVHGELTRYSAIPNMLSYDVINVDTQLHKNKTILLVARMDERQKRVRHALQIWQCVSHNGWQMKIVGGGEDLNYYKKLSQKWDIKDISFEGQQDPLNYYQDASIFMMTSAFEGWPMTLMEAIPCGCVPIVFDSFCAIHDIIESGKNGIIVPEGDIEAYVCQLQGLMNNPKELKRLSENARKDCMRFSRENIAKQWKTLLENL